MYSRHLLLLAVLVPALAGAAAANPDDVDGDWLSSVQQQIAVGEYHVTWQEEWHAPNRAHNLRTYFTKEGIRVVPRTESEPSWEWSLSLIGHGRGETASPVEVPVLSPNENRIDYDRGNIVEWYINDRRGLEQGFTLAGPPNGSVEDAPAYLILQLGGTLSPVISTDGQAIDFATPGGAKVLHYAALKVTDAMEQEIPAWMEVFAEAGVRGIRIVFDDREAAYPVTIDPLATSPAWTAEGDQASARFGFSMSTAGDVNGDGYSDVIVGADWYDNGQGGEGRAFVYHGSPAGLSGSPAWTAESNQSLAYFGRSVSTAGDVNGDGYADVIVGAPFYDYGAVNEGRAFVYHGSAVGLSATAAWTARSGQANAYFGVSVSTAGDVNGDGYTDVVVGADFYGNGETSGGLAYVYHGSLAGLSSTADWTAESDQLSACFGHNVSTAGDVNGDGYGDVIVGAYSYDNGESSEGRAYVFHGSAAGLSVIANWTAESDQASACFGWSVSTAGDVNGDGYADVIIGARYYDNGESNEGRAFVYHGSSAGLSVSSSWTAESDQASAYLGWSVSTAGDVNGDGYADVIVGAHRYDNGETDEGRAYVYNGSAAGLSATADWTAESDQASAYFGFSVATAGDVNGDGYSDVIAGAYFYDNGESDEGRAFAYHGSAAGLSAVDGWTAECNQAYAHFGTSISTAGDVNGDGYADVIVGADYYDNGQSTEGRAFVYYGSSIGLSTTAAWTAESNQAAAHFGSSVSTAGDVNGDGYADVIVGAKSYDNGETDEGRAFVYHGSAAGLSAAPDWTAESDQADAWFGVPVSTAGDVNGDGYGDVIVGAYNYDNGETDEGRAYVYHGSSAGLSATADWTAESDQAAAHFGRSASAAGDVNGDGHGDVIIGADCYDNGETNEGRAFVYHGSVDGLSATPAWTAESDQAGALFGFSVSKAGDVNGDGYADVIVGAYNYDNDEYAEGRTFAYHGSASGLSPVADWIAESGQAYTSFGCAVSTAGDVNGDGYADVIAGAYSYDNGEADEGRAFVYHGSGAGLSTSVDWTAESNQAGAYFGWSVASAGDVNGDGYADVIIGAARYDNGEAGEGRTYVYFGGGGPGLSLVPQQWQPVDDMQINPLGSSDAVDEFRIRLRGLSPFGSGRAQLEWEVKSLGALFDGIGTATSTFWEELAGGTVQFSEPVTGLAEGTPYHWRVRLRYDGTSTPYQQYSRWITVPWNGWNETDLRTAVDGDDDGYAAGLDCNDTDPDVWSVPGEVVSLVVLEDKQIFSWDQPSMPGGTEGSIEYDLLRSSYPNDFVAMAVCIAMDYSMTWAYDGTNPFPGQLLAYLVRAENACGLGSLGQNSYGMERTGRTCP